MWPEWQPEQTGGAPFVYIAVEVLPTTRSPTLVVRIADHSQCLHGDDRPPRDDHVVDHVHPYHEARGVKPPRLSSPSYRCVSLASASEARSTRSRVIRSFSIRVLP